MSAIGTFVATFPFYGGMSPERIRRALRPEVHGLADRQGVVLTSELVFRLDRTRHAAFVVVEAEAFSTRSAAEVREHAQVMAYEHEHAHPGLSAWISRRLRGVRA